MSNHLKGQSSPYLLQHAENPVEWYPWSEEAFAKAEKEDKPIFLSIGYSTCHWCHVMAHESFEKEEIAEILNRSFVSIKVDREERPDIDSVYMTVCQAFTGNGGWPMSIFMTAQQKPFFAGTYFPPTARYGRIGFRELLQTVAEKWETDREGLLETSEMIFAQLRGDEADSRKETDETDHVSSQTKQAAALFAASFDSEYGGFGSAPKFPIPHNLIFLILFAAIYQDDAAWQQASKTLVQMRKGGIFDQIGYGFSRYSTDASYLVPHFEKMLYDNALLILAYTVAYGYSCEQSFLDTAKQTTEYIFREMCGGEGEFFSAQDADSKGEEGRFYVWRYEEIIKVLGAERGTAFCARFGITEKGNFEGKNIPNLLDGDGLSDDFAKERKLLYEYRKKRASLHLDDKILTSWNALMICALSLLYRVTGDDPYLLAAERAQKFIERYLAKGDVLYVSCRDHMPSVKGFLDDYAYYTAALIGLYETTLNSLYLKRAMQICGEAILQFGAGRGNGYYLCGTQNDSLITTPKDTYDGALPSGNSVMAYCLVRLSQLTQSEEYEHAAKEQLRFMSAAAKHYPAGYSMFLIAQLINDYPPQKITVVLSEDDRRKQENERGLSSKSAVCRMPLYADLTLLEHATEEYGLINQKTTYYVCKDRTCFSPTNEAPGRQHTL